MEDILIIKNFLSKGVSDYLFKYLKEHVDWKDTLFIKESYETKKIKRKMEYVSDRAQEYFYANLSFYGNEWEKYIPLGIIRDLLSFENSEYIFNSVLLNMYEDGKDEINWHSDKEETLGERPIIACVNLGATRKMWFRLKSPDSEKFFHEVSHGDLLVMGPDCQKKYLHAILKESDVKEPRISLTYRFNHEN